MAAARSWSRILSLYHFPCPDGITAALAAHLHHQQLPHLPPGTFQLRPFTTYSPLTVESLRLAGNELVYLLDFIGPPGFARAVAQAAGRCVVLDHHKTAVEELSGALPPNLEVHLDMHRSGATIALDYFRPEGLTPAQRQLFAYIEDGDLWRWALPDSRAFAAGFAALGLDLDATTNPGIFDQLLALTPESVIAAGRPEMARRAAIVADAMRRAHVIELGGAGRRWGRALATDLPPEEATLRSELGNELAEESARRGLRAMAAVAYEEGGIQEAGLIKVSLRSVGEGEDVTPIARAYGGGGHRNAGSFLMPREEFAAWRCE